MGIKVEFTLSVTTPRYFVSFDFITFLKYREYIAMAQECHWHRSSWNSSNRNWRGSEMGDVDCEFLECFQIIATFPWWAETRRNAASGAIERAGATASSIRREASASDSQPTGSWWPATSPGQPRTSSPPHTIVSTHISSHRVVLFFFTSRYSPLVFLWINIRQLFPTTLLRLVPRKWFESTLQNS